MKIPEGLVCERGAAREYRLGTQRFFSVSQVRKVAHDPYVGIAADVLAPAARRGRVLHLWFWKALAAHAGVTDWPATLPELAGYCASIEKWIRGRVVPGIEGLYHIEEPSYADQGFAGTPDALVECWKPKGKREPSVMTLVDLKTGAPTVTDKMQLVAYQQLLAYQDARRLVDVYAQEDGTGAVEVEVSAADRPGQWAWFVSALGVLQGRENYGVSRKEAR